MKQNLCADTYALFLQAWSHILYTFLFKSSQDLPVSYEDTYVGTYSTYVYYNHRLLWFISKL